MTTKEDNNDNASFEQGMDFLEKARYHLNTTSQNMAFTLDDGEIGFLNHLNFDLTKILVSFGCVTQRIRQRLKNETEQETKQ